MNPLYSLQYIASKEDLGENLLLYIASKEVLRPSRTLQILFMIVKQPM